MANGKSLGFTNWSPNQPDGTPWGPNREAEACIEITHNVWQNKWNDARCVSDRFYYICEEDSSNCQDENPTIVINSNAIANANANSAN